MKILISGGGIAGLTLAYWLHQRGVEATIVEQARGLRRDGYGIDFYSTGYDVGERMGIIERLRPKQIRASYLAYLDESGQPAAKLSLDAMRSALDGKYMALMHYTLEEELYAAIQQDVPVRFGTTIKRIDPSADAVSVTLDDGTQASFDLVVGADGIHSNVRSLVFGPETEFARYMGYYTAAYTLPARYGVDDGWVNYSEPGRQVGLYPSDKAGEVVTLFIFQAEDEGPVPHAERLAKLREVYQGMGWITPQLLADTPDDTPIFMDTVTQIVMPAWSQGRVVLVGDACSCMTLVSGQGASMAMGGAYMLAEDLDRYPDDYRRAFLNFEHRLRPEIELRQRKAHDFAKTFVPGSKLGVKAQQVIMKLLFHDLFFGLFKAQILGESILLEKQLRRLPESGGNVIGYEVAGRLTDSDYETFTLDVEEQLSRSDGVRLLLQVDELAGLTPKALWDDFKFGVEHGRQVERLAIVGDRRFAGWLANLSQPFYAHRAKHFANDEIEQAWAWLRAEAVSQ